MVSEDELSFVVQGPISKNNNQTQKILFEIRKNFPQSKIILSTWINSNVYGLEFDELILNEDPGAILQDDVNKVYDNTNRQLVSSLNGVRACTTKYCIKTRTDILFKNRKILPFFSDKIYRDPEYSFSKKRFIVPNYNTKNPDRIPLPHHPSDLVVGGLTEDLINLYDIPLRDYETTRYFEKHKKPENFPYDDLLCRYTAESYIWTSYLLKKMKLCFQHSSDLSNGNVELTKIIFANNLIVVNPSMMGIRFVKYPFRELKSYYSYTYNEWLKLCKQYCDCKINIKKIDYSRILYNLYFNCRRFYYFIKGSSLLN